MIFRVHQCSVLEVYNIRYDVLGGGDWILRDLPSVLEYLSLELRFLFVVAEVKNAKLLVCEYGRDYLVLVD